MYKGSAKVVVVVDDVDSALPLSESEPLPCEQRPFDLPR